MHASFLFRLLPAPKLVQKKKKDRPNENVQTGRPDQRAKGVSSRAEIDRFVRGKNAARLAIRYLYKIKSNYIWKF